MQGYLFLLPIFLTFWAIIGVWIVFGIAVANGAVDLKKGFPFISFCGSYPPQSCIFSQVLNVGAALAICICIVRYHQLRDWGVKKWHNQLILWAGVLCGLGTSIVGNFQEINQKPTHLAGAFFAFILGILYFWLQLILYWRVKGLPRPGPCWMGTLRLIFCSVATILIVAMIILHSLSLRSASAICEWTVAMLLFTMFGFLSVDFSKLQACVLQLQPRTDSSTPTSPETPKVLWSQAM